MDEVDRQRVFSFPTHPFPSYHRFVCLSNILLIENFIIFPDVLCFKACTETLSRISFLSVRTPPDIFSAIKTLATCPVSKSVSNHVRMHFFQSSIINFFMQKFHVFTLWRMYDTTNSAVNNLPIRDYFMGLVPTVP